MMESGKSQMCRLEARGSADVECQKYSHRDHNHDTHSLVLSARKAHWFMSIGRFEMS